ncbi:MAG: pyridoxamine 5'-phosphate oxidase family protein [Actinomycetes bacterium]
MPFPDRASLPHWADGTVAILSTVGDGPHAIPVSTGLRAGDELLLIALAARRQSLANLRVEPRVAVSFLAEGDVAVTVHGVAEVVADPMEISDRVCAVAIRTSRIQDHGQSRFVIEGGADWSWTDDEAAERDKAVREELGRIAAALVAS